MHSLIKRITIKHVKKERGGYYLVKIDYTGFDESSMFLTKWGANLWCWLSYYRSQAITKEDLEDDMELFEYLMKTSGKKIINSDDLKNIKNPSKELVDYVNKYAGRKPEIPEDFKGYESMSSPIESFIKLKKEELIHFD